MLILFCLVCFKYALFKFTLFKKGFSERVLIGYFA